MMRKINGGTRNTLSMSGKTNIVSVHLQDVALSYYVGVYDDVKESTEVAEFNHLFK